MKTYARMTSMWGERGASMVEYAFLIILIALVAFLAVQVFGTELSGTYSEIGDGFDAGS